MNGWIGVDFDGTLAQYDTWLSATHCGEPIAPMVERVKRWRAEGREVRIFTARVFPLTDVVPPSDWHFFVQPPPPGDPRRAQAFLSVRAIHDWCHQHIGERLPITCVKDYGMIELYDDRAVQVRPNTGELVGFSTRGLTPAEEEEHNARLYRHG